MSSVEASRSPKDFPLRSLLTMVVLPNAKNGLTVLQPERACAYRALVIMFRQLIMEEPVS